MVKTIEQRIKFKVSAKRLYQTYINAKAHAAAIDASAKITDKVGAAFSIFDGYIKGKNLWLKKDATIVQTWRGADWGKHDADSILVLNFTSLKGGSQLHMIHTLVPDKAAKGITKGWHTFYWEPWQKYFKG